MLVPSPFRSPNPDIDLEMLRSYPLATLVSSSEGAPFASEVPVIVSPDFDASRPLEGQIIWGHLNRFNAHATHLQTGQQAKVVVTGPRAYVSPTLYPNGPSAPTFDFISLHLSGLITAIDDSEDVFEIVSTTARILETRLGRGWDPEPSHDYFRSIQHAVRGFHLAVETVEAMYKLSQDKDVVTREAIEKSMTAASGEVGDLGHYMQQHFSVISYEDQP